jgi:hypothetical protein
MSGVCGPLGRVDTARTESSRQLGLEPHARAGDLDDAAGPNRLAQDVHARSNAKPW